MTYSDVVAVIDQYEVIPPEHAEAIVKALRRKGYKVALGLRQVKLYSGPNVLYEGLLPVDSDFVWETPGHISARLSRVEIN